jgi:hypothetical protein
VGAGQASRAPRAAAPLRALLWAARGLGIGLRAVWLAIVHMLGAFWLTRQVGLGARIVWQAIVHRSTTAA